MRIRLMPLVSAFVILLTTFPGYADPPLPNIPATNFNVTTFGAVGNGTTDNAGSIQNAINAAAAVGGGTVVVAAVGVLTNYLSGPINLTNNVCLQINAGTKLQMLPMSSWPNASTPFINGTKLHDVEINGSGTIDGQGTNWWFPLASTRPNFINFSGCSNVLIQGVTLQNPPTFHIMVKGNNVNLTIQGMTEKTPFDSHNTDGMDLASTNVLIRNCSISVGDDNIEIGGSGGAAANVTVSNCFFGSGHGLSIGSLIATQFVGDVRGVHDLLVSNCTFNGTEYGIHMKSDRDRGGTVKNARYLDLIMTNVTFPIAIYGFYNTIGTPKTTINFTPLDAATNASAAVIATTPIWRDITISNVSATAIGGNIAGIIMGMPEMLASNITLYNVNITAPTNTFCIYHAQAIRIINSNLTAPNTATNTLTLYDADITLINSAANTNLVTLGGLAIPPTNNTLAFFNAQAVVTDTNLLGTGLITLGGSTLTFTQSSAAFSNNIAVLSTSTVAMTSGSNLFGGSLTGPGALALNLPANSLLRMLGDPSGFTGALLVSNGTLVVKNVLGAGTLTAAGGTLSLGSLAAGLPGTPTGIVWVTGGQLIATNTTSILGSATNSVGSATVSNGNVVVADLVLGNALGSQGTLTVAGGTNTLSSTLTVASAAGSTGAVWVTGGRLDAGLNQINLGSSGAGLMTVSNGTVAAGTLFIGFLGTSRGTLTIAGGTTTPSLNLSEGLNGGTGTVWVTGGQLGPTLAIQVGRSGRGQMTISNGTVLTRSIVIGSGGIGITSPGGLTMAGGNLVITNVGDGLLNVGAANPGTYTQNGGIVTVDNLFVTNVANSVFIFNGGMFQVGATSINNGQQFAVGDGATAATYHLLGGTHVFNNGLRVRNSATLSGCGTVTGVVVVDPGGTIVADCGGSLTFTGSVTNNGTMQAINGSVLESYGPVVNNGLIDITDGTTNFHSTFVNNGSIVGGSALVFQIGSIVPQGNNILVTWATTPGKTNELQVTSGGAGGSYSTNNFAAIFTVTNTVGTVTNYLDVGGATNFPARYYRVLLVP